jgi:hypothetical protein
MPLKTPKNNCESLGHGLATFFELAERDIYGASSLG